MAKNGLVHTPELLVIGGSSGSLDVILKLLSGLPNNFPLSVVVVVHRKNTSDSALSDLLTYRSALPVVEVEDKEPVKASRVYLVPSDYHLLFEKKQVFSL